MTLRNGLSETGRTTRRRRWPVLAAAGVFAATLVAGGTSVALAETAPAQTVAGGRFTLPEGSPTPGAGFEILSAYKVILGVQIYTCVAAPDGTGAWSTPASVPEAHLRRYRKPGSIHHYGGPRWTSNLDGSTVLGAVATRVPKDGTIPWLLLTVTHEKPADGTLAARRGRGELDPVTHISRVNTSGGVGPTGACTPGIADQQVKYGADYVFWKSAA